MRNISEKLKRLVKLNNETKKLEKQEIVSDIRKELTTDDELAILRKTVAYLFNIIQELHECELSITEFEEYNNLIEGIKTKVKTEI